MSATNTLDSNLPLFYVGNHVQVELFDYTTKSHYIQDATVSLIMQKSDKSWKYRLSIPYKSGRGKFNQDYSGSEYNGKYFTKGVFN